MLDLLRLWKIVKEPEFKIANGQFVFNENFISKEEY